ncbi:MAG: hypothetical protein ABIR54_23875 [Burkholderiaceae bacterium]
MNRLLTLILLPMALGAAGCASKASMDAQYDASLQRWQGATRAELEAKWGRPTLVQLGADGGVLTWIVRNDAVDDRPGAVVIVRSGANGDPGHFMGGAPAPAVVPITCTTRFAMKDGRVASWKFEGLGCGAPY